jgi:hypothetical protein
MCARSAAARISTNPAQLVVGDASTATFAFMWAGSGRTNAPWGRAMTECRASTPRDALLCLRISYRQR